MRLQDLALGVRQDRREGSVKDAGAARHERGTVMSIEPLSPRLGADQLHALVLDERIEGSDRIRSPADARDHPRRKLALRGERLLAGLVADHALEVTDKGRVRRRPDRGADYVVRRADVRDPVADRRAHGLLQGSRPRLHRAHLGAQQPHPLDIRGLAPHVLRAHVHDAFEPQQGACGRRGHAMLAGAGLGDDPLLAHPASEERLPDRVVDLVCAGMGQVLALQVDTMPDALGQP